MGDQPRDTNAKASGPGEERGPGISDSIRCGGAACLLILLMDVMALVKGSRADIPAGAAWVAVAGLVLPVLNLYFIIKDFVSGRRREAGIGLLLSLLALALAFYPPWGRHVLR